MEGLPVHIVFFAYRPEIRGSHYGHFDLLADRHAGMIIPSDWSEIDSANLRKSINNKEMNRNQEKYVYGSCILFVALHIN